MACLELLDIGLDRLAPDVVALGAQVQVDSKILFSLVSGLRGHACWMEGQMATAPPVADKCNRTIERRCIGAFEFAARH